MREPLVLLPGFMCDARVFGPQIDDLSRDHMVIVAAPVMGDTIREMATYILEQLPNSFALAGHDLGGIVAMEIARRAPERVTRLALISTTPLPDTPAQATWREPQIVRASAGRLLEAMAEAVPVEHIAQGPRKDHVAGLVQHMAAGLGADVFIRQSRALQRRSDAQRVLQKIRIPSMVLCGAQDGLIPPKRHEVMASLIDGAELVILNDVGHLPTIEAPEQVNIGMRAWLEMPQLTR